MRLRAEGNRTHGQDYGGMGHFISDLHMILLWGLPYLHEFCRRSASMLGRAEGLLGKEMLVLFF